MKTTKNETRTGGWEAVAVIETANGAAVARFVGLTRAQAEGRVASLVRRAWCAGAYAQETK